MVRQAAYQEGQEAFGGNRYHFVMWSCNKRVGLEAQSGVGSSRTLPRVQSLVGSRSTALRLTAHLIELEVVIMETRIAKEFGLTLCDFCKQPKEIHTGFDHRERKCLVARDHISMTMRYPQKHERDDAIERVNAFYAAVEDAEQAQLDIGAGI